MSVNVELAAEKLGTAIIALYETHLFYYFIFKNISRIATRSISTMGVGFAKDNSGRIMLIYNPEFVEKCSFSFLQAVLNHECQHLVFQHVRRVRNLKPFIFNLAADVIVNSNIPELKNFPEESAKLCFPENFESLKGVDVLEKTVEEVYKLINDEVEKEKEKMKNMIQYCNSTHESWQEGEEAGASLTSAQQAALDELVKEAVRDLGNRHPGNVPGSISRMIEELRKVKMDWRRMLSIFVQSVAQEDKQATWKRINRRLKYIMPGYKKEMKPKLLVVIDNSGSITPDLYNMFMAHILKISQVCREVSGIGCDTEVNCEFTVKNGVVPPNFDFKSGGGTLFQPAFDYAKKGKFDGVVYLTDGCCFDESLNTYHVPVIFAVCEGGKEMEGFKNIKITED